MEKTPTPKKSPETLRRECVVREGVHLREAPEGQESRTIEGYAILFNTPSAVLWSEDDGKIEAREIIAPEAVTRELLDASDIKFTLFHDRQLILARSYYWKSDYVDRNVKTEATGKQLITYTVRQMVGVYDMTLAADPAYPDTSVSLREQFEPAPAPPVDDTAEQERERQLEEMAQVLKKHKY